MFYLTTKDVEALMLICAACGHEVRKTTNECGGRKIDDAKKFCRR